SAARRAPRFRWCSPSRAATPRERKRLSQPRSRAWERLSRPRSRAWERLSRPRSPESGLGRGRGLRGLGRQRSFDLALDAAQEAFDEERTLAGIVTAVAVARLDVFELLARLGDHGLVRPNATHDVALVRPEERDQGGEREPG